VREDILGFLSVPPYHMIFPGREDIAGVLADMDNVRLLAPFLGALDFFKEQDFYSYRHFLMVFGLSTLLAKALTASYEDLIRLCSTGPTHDIGKICVPLRILRKEAPLTRAEKAILDNHSAAGYVLLSYYLGDPRSLASLVARDHHERKDGSGYPRGIPLRDLLVEVIAVCDVYDALISPRPYRPASYDNRTALEEITGMAERGEIGWDVVKALVACNRSARPHYSESEVSTEKRGVPPPGNLHGVIEDEGAG
jgi:HD-GYP domain-containing protein (c-di-GMP phosphodiesterase class II)